MVKSKFYNLDTDETLSSNSDYYVPSEKAIKTYVDTNIPTVNNATLTITQNGVSKGTFTANASSNVTIALDGGGGGGSYTAGTGINITNDVISVTSPTLTNTTSATEALEIKGAGVDLDLGTADNAIAISGYRAFAEGSYSIAIGYDIDVTGLCAVAIVPHDYNNYITGNYSVTIGDESAGYGNYSIAIGKNAYANEDYSIQLGKGTNTTAKTLAVGFGLDGSNNPIEYTLLNGTTGLIPDDRISSNIARSSAIPTVNDGTLTIQKNGTDIDTFSANERNDKTINILIPTQASDINAMPDSVKYGSSLSLSIDNSTYVVTAQLKDQDGNNLGSAQTIDLPLESVVVNGSYDSENKKVILTLENGSTIEFSVADLVAGLQSEITEYNKLDADLVDDSTSSNKFVTTSEKSLISSALQPNDNISELVNDSGFITSADLPTNYVTTDTAQDISAKKTFLGEKAILFKQTATTDKLGFTLYTASNSELGALEYRPNTISGNPLLNLNCSQSGNVWLGFRYWSNINIIAPKPSNGNYYIPVNFTDGNTTVTAGSNGTVNISSLLPSSAVWGNIRGDLSNQTDLQNALDEKADVLKVNVADIVSTYADLQSYDTSNVTPNSIIKVITDETNGGKTSWYKWDIQGSETPFVQPVLSENGTIGGDSFAVALSTVYNGRNAWLAFDGVTTQNATWTNVAHSQNVANSYIEFYNPTPICVTKINIWNGNILPLEVDFQCSSDGTNWTTLTSASCPYRVESEGQGKEWSFDVSNTNFYKYYRIVVKSSTYGNFATFLEIAITATEGGNYGWVKVKDEGKYATETWVNSNLDTKQDKLTSANAGTDISIVSEILPSAYKRVTGFTMNNDCYFQITGFYLKGSDTLRFSFTQTTNSVNVLGCFTSPSDTNNYSLYSGTNSNAKYLRYNGGTYSSTIALNKKYDVVITPTGVTGLEQSSSWTAQSFTSAADFCIGTSSPSVSSSKFIGTFHGEIVVDGRARFIPCERLSDNVLGYYEYESGTFYTPAVGTPVSTGYDNVPALTISFTNDSGFITGITSGDVTTALGYTPYNSSNPNGYTSNVGTVTSVNNVSPDSNGNVTLSGVTVDQTYDATSANAQSGVAIAGAGFLTGISSSDVTTALGYTPYNSSNPDGYTDNVGTVTSVNNVSPDNNGNVSLSIPTATSDLSNDSGFITGINSSDVTTALGYTPANDSDVVKTSGNQTIDDIKTFTVHQKLRGNTLKRVNVARGSTPTSNQMASIYMTDSTENNGDNNTFGLIRTQVDTSGNVQSFISAFKNITAGTNYNINLVAEYNASEYKIRLGGNPLGTDTNGSLSTVTNSTANNTIPTMGWVNNPSTSTNVVHRTGTETIGGDKTFSNQIKATLASYSATNSSSNASPYKKIGSCVLTGTYQSVIIPFLYSKINSNIIDSTYFGKISLRTEGTAGTLNADYCGIALETYPEFIQNGNINFYLCYKNNYPESNQVTCEIWVYVGSTYTGVNIMPMRVGSGGASYSTSTMTWGNNLVESATLPDGYTSKIHTVTNVYAKTQTSTDNSTKIATTAYVKSNLTDYLPSASVYYSGSTLYIG